MTKRHTETGGGQEKRAGQEKKREDGSLFVVAREKSAAALPAMGRELGADWREVLLPRTALFVIRPASLSAALSGRLYVHKIACVHIFMHVCVCVCPALGTKSDRKVV